MTPSTATRALMSGLVTSQTLVAPVLANGTGDAWGLITGIQIEEQVTADSYSVTKIYPSAIEGGVSQFDITGYLYPLEDMSAPGAKTGQFMLVSDMGFCPFCGNPDHGAALEVSLATPMAGLTEGMRLTLRGELELVTDPETWQAAKLTGANILR